MTSNRFEPRVPTYTSSDPRVTVGRYTYGNPQLLLWTESERIEIGSFCSIAASVTIFAGGEHNCNWVTTYPLRIVLGLPLAGEDGHPRTKGDTVIGNDVWIGYGASVLSGVRVGHGAVIGAHSLVAKDVPPYAVVAGNPARLVRFRFDEGTIEHLLRIRWWDWPIQKIVQNVEWLCGGDPMDSVPGMF